MACNCNGGHPMPPPIIGPGHDCNHVNHVFDPNPPNFHGTWRPDCGCGCGKTSTVVAPGNCSGLYRCGGPLNCTCDKASIYSLTGVETTARITLEVKLSYANSNLNKTVIVEPGKVYSFTYLENGVLKNCTGLVSNIFKIDQLEETTDIYKIKVDCSVNYANNVVVFKTDQIRYVEAYSPYIGADKGLANAEHKCGTTIAARIINATVLDAELDKNKNIVKGHIVAGTLEGCTLDGIVVGINKDQLYLAMINSQSNGGEITDGYFLNGIVAEGDIDGTVDEDTGYVTNATIRGTITNALIINTYVSGANVESEKNQGATILDTTLTDTTVVGTEVTGSNMVTTGGITIGDVTTGGVTRGGTAEGGTCIYTTEDGTRVAYTGGTTTGDIVTSGGVLVGGVISGGTRIGNAIYGATVTGGVLKGGTTTGGTSTYDLSKDRVEPASTSYESPVGRIVYNNPNWADVNAKVDGFQHILNGYDDLVLATDRHTHTDLYTNFGTCTMEKVSGQKGVRRK